MPPYQNYSNFPLSQAYLHQFVYPNSSFFSFFLYILFYMLIHLIQLFKFMKPISIKENKRPQFPRNQTKSFAASLFLLNVHPLTAYDSRILFPFDFQKVSQEPNRPLGLYNYYYFFSIKKRRRRKKWIGLPEMMKRNSIFRNLPWRHHSRN